ATRRWTFALRPRQNGFISDCREQYLPNRFNYNAYNVFGFEVGRGSGNPFLSSFQELNWSFITAVVLSFVALLLTFDTVSGERQSKTLALVLANPIPRATVLSGKYISAILTTTLMAVVGVILSSLIVLASATVDPSLATFGEIPGFLLLALLFISCVAAFGILSSVLVRDSNVSLLIALAFWLFFVVVIPNTAVFWANKVFSIEHADTINRRINIAKEDLRRNAPEGSNSSNPDDPFTPEHRLRAELRMKYLNSEAAVRNAYFKDMFRQLEHTRLLTAISPTALFDYAHEAVVGGGYVRFRKTWDDLHEYQSQFLQFFKMVDAEDPNSPHWYNPYESLSTTREPVNFAEVPVFKERPISFAYRLFSLRNYLAMMIAYTAVVLSLAFVFFLRYDVR
ncbi:MAG: ABC transporter permease, partial [Phycisphaerales bacterium]